MIYQLYRAVDRRDNTEALWLLRAPSGAHPEGRNYDLPTLPSRRQAG
nr:MAG TPA: hypothetical protein [Caudoviricetes sp.]